MATFSCHRQIAGGAAADPHSLKVPVATYVPITNVEGFTKHGFPPVPALEQNLMASFGLKLANTSLTAATSELYRLWLTMWLG